MKKVHVLYHDNCFDGVASAAVFSRFYKERIDPNVEINYEGLAHRAGQKIGEEFLTGDENAIVDFKYSPSERLTWWFDHHESAFLSPEDEAHFKCDRSGQKFHDQNYRSCTKFIATITREKFGFEITPLADLIHWADIIDGAQFPDAQSAVELKEPAMQLMLVIEAAHDPEFLYKLIQDLQHKSLEDAANDPDVRSRFQSLYNQHLESIEILRRSARFRDGVIEFDLSGYEIDGYNKFIPYYLFPEGIYTVGVSCSPMRAKVSVGTNPWKTHQRRHNLAKLCEQYGGGGHSVVAAISFQPHELVAARRAAREIAEKLRKDLLLQ